MPDAGHFSHIDNQQEGLDSITTFACDHGIDAGN